MSAFFRIRIAERLRFRPNRNYVFAFILLAVTLLAYQPAWKGKPIMDDARHLIAPEQRSLEGFNALWTKPDTTQQYHPLVDTLFWVEDKLWGNSMLGYHIVNILLHVASALLLLKILQRLEVPGAWLAAAIFALHPVQVESVAFLVELKNTLSALFFFSAMLVYLRFDENRDRKFYLLFSLLFVVGLFAKTVLALLPAAILIALWWKRGRLEWRRDVLPLIPFAVLGIAAGVATGWMEREFSQAKGEGFEFSLFERLLIAGRAFWFYLGKIFWPSNLMLMYPRWNISPTVWWQYLFPIAALTLLTIAWALRRRWRWLLAGMLFFTAMALPFLGLHSMRIFRFQFVADHFQYLPIIGIIVPAAAGAATLLNRLRGWQRITGYTLCFSLLATLTVLSWRHSRMFRDSETCYRMVIEGYPGSWPAHFNLGYALLREGRQDEALVHFKKVLELNPDDLAAVKGVNLNLGAVFLKKGYVDMAIFYYEKMLEVGPDYRAYVGMGNALHRKGKFEEAIANYNKALEIEPKSAVVKSNLAWMLATAPEASLRNGPRALELAEQAVLSHEYEPLFLRTLAAAYAESGNFPKAIETAQRASQLATTQKMTGMIKALRNELALYELELPYRETPNSASAVF
jgi:tetratricopeptide (TPR) repeat protein